MNSNSLRYLRLLSAVYVALMGIVTPSTADVPTTLVVTDNFDNNPISLVDIPTVSRMMFFLSQPIVAMHCAMICPIDTCPVITQCRILMSPYMPRPGTPTRNFPSQI